MASMTPQDRPARRFDEPPAYEDLELICGCADPGGAYCRVTTGYHRCFVDPWRESREAEQAELARHSHLGAILIVAAIVGLALIAVALFVRGAS
jgi:hypothetical protein